MHNATTTHFPISFFHINLSNISILPPNIQPKLSRVQARINANNNQDDRHQDRPQLQIQHIDIKVRVDGRHHRSEYERIEQIPAHAVIFPNFFRILDAAKRKPGDPPHGKAHDILQRQDHACRHAEVAMDRVEMAAGALLDLVGLDEQDAGGEEEERQQVEGGVVAGAEGLFLWGPGGLEDEDGFGQGEDAGGLEEGVGAEEGDEGGVAEDGGED